jgi:hypothetical protein
VSPISYRRPSNFTKSTIAETLYDKAAVSGCADVDEERWKGRVGDEPDVVLNLVGEVKYESHALDAAELGGGNGVDPVLNEGKSADFEEHCEVLESIVHETRFGAELSVDLEKAWLLGPDELGDVTLGCGKQDELKDFGAQFRRELQKVRLNRVELGGLRVSGLVLGCHCFGWVAGDGGAGICWGLLVSLIRHRRRWLLVVVKTLHQELFSCVGQGDAMVGIASSTLRRFH